MVNSIGNNSRERTEKVLSLSLKEKRIKMKYVLFYCFGRPTINTSNMFKGNYKSLNEFIAEFDTLEDAKKARVPLLAIHKQKMKDLKKKYSKVENLI